MSTIRPQSPVSCENRLKEVISSVLFILTTSGITYDKMERVQDDLEEIQYDLPKHVEMRKHNCKIITHPFKETIKHYNATYTHVIETVNGIRVSECLEFKTVFQYNTHQYKLEYLLNGEPIVLEKLVGTLNEIAQS